MEFNEPPPLNYPIFTSKIESKKKVEQHPSLDVLRKSNLGVYTQLMNISNICDKGILPIRSISCNKRTTYIEINYILQNVVGNLFDVFFGKLANGKHLWEVEKEDLLLLLNSVFDPIIFLHSNNIVHRDIKPENYLLIKDGDMLKVILADLETARFIGELNDDFGDEGTFGTDGYLSSEQNYRNSPVCAVMDSYSLAIMITELLSSYLVRKGSLATALDIIKENYGEDTYNIMFKAVGFRYSRTRYADISFFKSDLLRSLGLSQA